MALNFSRRGVKAGAVCLLYVSSLFLLFATGSMQRVAPGDEDDVCVELGVEPVSNQEILMASFYYRNLVQRVGSPWVVVNQDNNNDGLPFGSSTTWTQSGGTCARYVGVCGFQFGSQDNWLITQFINNTLRQQDVYIRVRYAINSRCSSGCLTTLDMYVLHTNEVNQSFVRNVSVFVNRPIAALTDTVRDGSTIVTRILRISADLSTSGLYVAFRDLGTCIGLSEVVVYYPTCDPISLELGANFSMNRLAGGTSVGSCFANMATDLSIPNDTLTATCTVRLSRRISQDELFTSWTISNGSSRCMCLPGYKFTSPSTVDQCEACPPFTFKDTLSNTDACQPCPLFSNTTENDTAATECPCDPGYYRAENKAALPCTIKPACSVTKITGRVKYNQRKKRTRFTFSSNDSGSGVTYKCKLNKRQFKECESPMIWNNLRKGEHTVTVRAFCNNNDAPAVKRKSFRFQIR